MLGRASVDTGHIHFALLALAAAGHQPDYPTAEGRAMKRALAAILQPQNQDKDGYFGGGDGSRMYGHGITTLLLALQLIVSSQAVIKELTSQGGWRYLPGSRDADLR